MAPIKLESVVSVSSEDTNHPASNLLKSDYSNVKWKCKTPGEKSISVVFRLAEPSKITGIDIGNENSAFVEVLVARSDEPEDFKVLLVSSSLMTLQEAKYGDNRSGVRMFKEESLCSEVAAHKWDRVKIVCSQPYVTYAPYGLSFVVLHGAADEPVKPMSTTSSSLGKFHLKDENDDVDSCMTPGLLFARRNEQSVTTPVVKIVSESSAKKLPVATPFVAKATKVNPNDAPVPDFSDSREKEKGKKPRVHAGSSKRDIKKVAAVTPSTSRKSPPKKTKASPSAIKPFKKSPMKPFNRLFENVVFVISGYQNPYRSELRSKALAMGAKYKADWDPTCTHLICAFMNTPKHQQVKGRGKVVTKDWIEESHAIRRHLPWRRFALDPRERALPESDEEIYEETVPVNRKKIDSDSDSDDDSVKRQQKRKTPKKTETPVVRPSTSNQPAIFSTTPSSSSTSSPSAVNPPSKDVTIYDMDTEEEMDPKDSEELNSARPAEADRLSADDDEEDDDDDDEFPNLESFFLGATFSILSDIQGDIRKKLRRYIIAHGGEVEADVSSEEVEYVITESASELKKVRESRPDLQGAKPEWIWNCHDRDKLLPVCFFSSF